MTLPEQDPMSKRRLRGTRFYVLRNYYALAIIGGFSLISLPIMYFSNFFKNLDAMYKRFEGRSDYLEARKYQVHYHLTHSSKGKAEAAYKIGVESLEWADLTKFDDILKDDKPGVDDF